MLSYLVVGMLGFVQHVAQPNLLCFWADCIAVSGLSCSNVLLVWYGVCCNSHLGTMFIASNLLLPSL